MTTRQLTKTTIKMSQNVAPQLPKKTQERIPTIIKLTIQGNTHQQIADQLDISRQTVERDLNEWRETGGFEAWLTSEYVALHEGLRDANPEEALRNITRLLARTITQKAEIKKEIRENVNVTVTTELLRKYELLFRTEVPTAPSPVQPDSAKEQVDTPPATPKASIIPVQ